MSPAGRRPGGSPRSLPGKPPAPSARLPADAPADFPFRQMRSSGSAFPLSAALPLRRERARGRRLPAEEAALRLLPAAAARCHRTVPLSRFLEFTIVTMRISTGAPQLSRVQYALLCVPLFPCNAARFAKEEGLGSLPAAFNNGWVCHCPLPEKGRGGIMKTGSKAPCWALDTTLQAYR